MTEQGTCCRKKIVRHEHARKQNMENKELNAMPGHFERLHELASRYRASQIKAAIAVNSEMLKFYSQLFPKLGNN